MMKYETIFGDNGKSTQFAQWPRFSQDEIDAVAAVLASGKVNYWTGEEGRLFEKEFAAFTDCKYAIALANGTVALELALHVLGVGPGDEVIIPSRTYIASASCVVMRGATPVITDVDPVSQNLTAETIERVLTSKTRAVIATHIAGWPCDMDPILKLARKHGLKVVEDCAQAHSASYKGRPVGSLGDVAAFSFCQDKIMTTGGEGGMLTTNDKKLWGRGWAYKDHGKSYEAIYNHRHSPGFRWLHEDFGTNWRLSEMQSAIGRIQLRKISQWKKIRQKQAEVLTKRFSKLQALRVTSPPPEIDHAYYKYYAFTRPEMLEIGWNRDRIMNEITALGVPCFTGICSEIYLEKAFDNTGLRPKSRLKVARELGETSLMFNIHPALSRNNIEDTCRAVEKVLCDASVNESPELFHQALGCR
jgi:dTDP-4-amino-4,6-dideoxygalactose transaminase